MELGKYSFGIGDRFGNQAPAQLKAINKAWEKGLEITPVWNKSHREHTIVKTHPGDTSKAADEAVQKSGWTSPYFIDADHINLSNVDLFIESSDFFTLDVADFIGKPASYVDQERLMNVWKNYEGKLKVPGISEPFRVNQDFMNDLAVKYVSPIVEAKKIYRHILEKKKGQEFITEVSMDEVDIPQTPPELFFILAGLATEGIPAQTIAPKFSGRFNKGVDYVGDVDLFAREFEQDLLVIDLAIKTFDLPSNLKLSVHSGSDKFSIYPYIGKLIRKQNKGIHVKTAGTSWLEELIGLALAGGNALKAVRDIYTTGFSRSSELMGPYASVININPEELPDPSRVTNWTGEQWANAIRHVPEHPEYNPNIRQLLHVSYKIAAEMGKDYLSLLKQHSEVIETQIIENLYDRHLVRLFDIQ